MDINYQENYDLIVIGGGPAGMMAAGRAAEKGANVLLLEKNNKLGKKLLITGKGRCNITNSELDLRKFIEHFDQNGKFLFSCLHQFGVKNIIDFFENRGVPIKEERGARIFPKSDKSLDVLNVLIDYLKENKVEIKTNAEVKAIICEKNKDITQSTNKDINKIKKIVLVNNQEIRAKKYAICTGGKSYPLTGSNGDGYQWLKKMGHTIIDPQPALAPVLVKEKWIKELEGLSLKNVEITIYQEKKNKNKDQVIQKIENKKKQKIDSRFGEALFTANGLSGPIILDMSKQIGKALKHYNVNLEIDFKPALDYQTLDKRIQKDFKKANNKMFKNSLNHLLPKTLIPVIVRLSGINPEKQVNIITKEERKKLLHLLKVFNLWVKKLDGFHKAIITTGGVDVKEIDPKTMQSKVISNLYFAGEILNLDGPTGGFNLQVCWSTGYALGNNFKAIK